MSLPKKYDPKEAEPRLMHFWQAAGSYHFDPDKDTSIYSIDTPPPTVSGHLHLGHVYSYSHPDFIARYQRMQGANVYYPMGYDDNGLPTERLVEGRLGITAAQVGRPAFIKKCLEVSEEAEKDYQALWQRLGLSIDWRYTYRTIDDYSRRISQLSFLRLFKEGLAYRRQAPAIWCPECHTSIAQAELNDMDRSSEFVTLRFELEDGSALPVATTRPELLPACVAIFVHPEDRRFKDLPGRQARIPYFGGQVPILADPGADPTKGTGIVMCCTFGDTTDVTWWYSHHLPLVEAIGRDGRMTEAAGPLARLHVADARAKVKEILGEQNLILDRQPTLQSIRVHERCDTPVEYIVAQQWFIRVLEQRQRLLEAAGKIHWHPEYMQSRYTAWVENLNWDWCISRQRYFGVPFPLWYCKACGEVMLADEDELPVDPTTQSPPRVCTCGSLEFIPEEDIFDTWATSSMSPQIVGAQLDNPALYAKVFPFSLRPQAHEIIRTWAFYTIVKSLYHYDSLPWSEVLISGWGLAGEGMGKISKSRGGGPMPPMEMIERYSADAVRYWAASTSPGKDSIISEEKIQNGARLVTKLWNVARFAERFLVEIEPAVRAPQAMLTPADRWMLSRLQRLIRRSEAHFQAYDYASAKNETESFFWNELADNYIEMCKQRLYDNDDPTHIGASYALRQALLALLKLFAPFLPFVTEEIYQGLFVKPADAFESSIHRAAWPQPDPTLEDEPAEEAGQLLVEIATAVRRYKSERNLSLGQELNRLQLGLVNGQSPEMKTALTQTLLASVADLKSVTRAREIELCEAPLSGKVEVKLTGGMILGID